MRAAEYDGRLGEGVDEVPRSIRPNYKSNNRSGTERHDIWRLRRDLESMPRKWYPVLAWAYQLGPDTNVPLNQYLQAKPSVSGLMERRGLELKYRNGQVYVRLALGVGDEA